MGRPMRLNITLYLNKAHHFIYIWVGAGAKLAARIYRDAGNSIQTIVDVRKS
jgi:hypothetical protein